MKNHGSAENERRDWIIDIRYIQALLGHAKINTTQVYTRLASDVCDRLLTVWDRQEQDGH